ncbi:hypothetical protein BDZ94DRAFT_1323921 [Collybia nuda]|uniref:Uncharacterized protein n=1 Tax=Collybia nuda TaxID=64659 RepID=A0A9P5Y398_9AGAR|nr:hypothetical protein BDZ94DRAFT_1323921 [Collybia nuda]
MIWTILAPELVLYWAIRQWIGARQFADKFHEFGWTKTHGYFLQMGGFMLYDTDGKTRMYVLKVQDLMDLFTQGKIMFPTITEEEIQDRSKGDGLTKAIAIFQTTWFVTQCIARHIQGLLVTELELITLAFATLNGLMYFFWWNKPLAIRYSIPVFLLEEPRGKQILQENESQPSSFWGQIGKSVRGMSPFYYWQTSTEQWEPRHMCRAILNFPRILLEGDLIEPLVKFCGANPFDQGSYIRVGTRYADGTKHSYGYQPGIIVVAIANLFGVIHCTAWSSPFPSTIEHILWRTCSIILLSIPNLFLLGFAMGEIAHYIPKPIREPLKPLTMFLVAIGAPVYAIARLALIVEAFVALRVLTPAALTEVQWTSFIPHI